MTTEYRMITFKSDKRQPRLGFRYRYRIEITILDADPSIANFVGANLKQVRRDAVAYLDFKMPYRKSHRPGTN